MGPLQKRNPARIFAGLPHFGKQLLHANRQKPLSGEPQSSIHVTIPVVGRPAKKLGQLTKHVKQSDEIRFAGIDPAARRARKPFAHLGDLKGMRPGAEDRTIAQVAEGRLLSCGFQTRFEAQARDAVLNANRPFIYGAVFSIGQAQNL